VLKYPAQQQTHLEMMALVLGIDFCEHLQHPTDLENKNLILIFLKKYKE
jgi:hypothetical protein